MPAVQILFYRDPGEAPPVLDWLLRLQPKQLEKARELLDRWQQKGMNCGAHADVLRDGIYELRASVQGVHYRILYFFHGKVAAVVSHGITKERAVPVREIERALERKTRFLTNPLKHSYGDKGGEE